MPNYTVQYQQIFDMTDTVEANSPEEAWRLVLDGEGNNEDQSPAEILDDDPDDHWVGLTEEIFNP